MRQKRAVPALLVLLLILAGCMPSVQPGTPEPSETAADRQSPAEAGGAAAADASDSQGGSSVGESQGVTTTRDQQGGTRSGPEGDCLIWARSLPQASLVQPWLVSGHPRYVASGTCRLRVHSDEVTIDLVLPPSADPAAAEAALQITGTGEPWVDVQTNPYSGEHVFLVHIPAGEPGERVSVRLSGPFGPDGEPVDLGFDLERVTTPGIALDYRLDGGEWMPVEPGSTLPRLPMDLRFRSVGGADLALAVHRLTARGLEVERQAGELTARLEAPPPHLVLDLNGVEADHGLMTSRSLLEVFTGEEPQLILLDPATGQEQTLGSAPANVYRTLAAPSGDRVALMATDPTSLIETEIWVLDLRSGELQRTGISLTSWQYQAFWRPDELVVADGHRIHRWRAGTEQAAVQRSGGSGFTGLSPDRRMLAGISYDMREEDEHMLAPASIVLHDLQTGADRLLAEGQIRVRIPHSESAPRLALSFTPDGAGLLIREPTPEFGGWRYLMLDIATGTLEEVPEPQTETEPEWVPGPGGFAYRTQADVYDDVVVRAADGAENHFGSGHAAGWAPDGRLLLIRWANSEWLRCPAGP